MILKHITLIAIFLVASISNNICQTTFKNPIITGMNPDPSICRVGDDFYLITSTFEYFPGIPIYHSKDLVHWKQIGYVLSRTSNCPLTGAHSSGGNYAPTIRYYNGTFYVTCTNYGGQGSQGAFFVTATNPAGPWSEPNWVNNWAVDPSLLFANDSIYYIHPGNQGEFMLTTLNCQTGKLNNDPKAIARGLGGSSPEGPHLYKINDYYYLMSAEGGTGLEHREVIQRSKSPWGPYEVSPLNPLISHKDDPENPFQAIGHADLVQLKDSSWWLVCLGIRPKGGGFHHLGRETFLAPVTWNENGWPKVGTDGIVDSKLLCPKLSQCIWEKELIRDDFNNDSLRLCWNFIRNPHPDDWSLTEKKGCLRLKGSKISLKDKDSPAFVGRRQTSFKMTASTKINFIPASANEEAGLVVRGDDINHFDLLINKLNNKRVVVLRKVLAGKIIEINHKEIPSGDVILKISSSELQYCFWVQKEGDKPILVGTAATCDISTEKIGGFIGTYIGMYASGNGKTNTLPAEFKWFDYEENIY
jgi:xylan 1,4-beta-xylosidase